jgi:hypothetical protein
MQTSKTVPYGAGGFNPIIEQCNGCDRIVEENSTQYCGSYMHPSAKWRLGLCNLATHAKPEIKVVTIKVNPLKAAKRASAKKKK